MRKLVFIFLPLLVLNACTSQYSSQGERLYLQSRNGEHIDVPPPLTRSNISAFYVLPQQTQDPRVSIIPPGLT